MTPDDPDDGAAQTERESAIIDALLSRPHVWDELPAGLEGAVVETIGAAVDADETRPSTAAASVDPPMLDEQRAARRLPAWLAAVAAAAVIVGGVALLTRDGTSVGTEIALAATDAAPGATAGAKVTATPAGLKILLDVDGLPGAPDGAYYEAWISDGTTRVSAGTFHLRQGDKEIELWAGVATPAFNRLSVTLEPLDDDTRSSGHVLLTGEFDLDG